MRWTNDKYPARYGHHLHASKPTVHILTPTFTYAHSKSQMCFIYTQHSSTPTWVLHRTFPHYSHHLYTLIYKSTINAHLHLANKGPSRVHHDPTSPTHSYATLDPCAPCHTQPVPHPSHTVKIYTVYASRLIPHCDAHTRFYASEHIHTHPCLPTGRLLACWLQWREALWHDNKQDLKMRVLNRQLLETRCVKHSHVPEWRFSAARSS